MAAPPGSPAENTIPDPRTPRPPSQPPPPPPPPTPVDGEMEDVSNLLDAALEGDIPRAKEIAAAMIRPGRSLESALASIGHPVHGPLHLAAAMGHAGFCEMLLREFLMDVDRANDEDVRPLAFAIEGKGDLETVRTLIKNGANPFKAGRSGVSPLHAAVSRGLNAIADLLSSGAAPHAVCPAGGLRADTNWHEDRQYIENFSACARKLMSHPDLVEYVQ
ncbi:hypothetical protein ACP4OV_025548 [Aristida adscensionis]